MADHMPRRPSPKQPSARPSAAPLELGRAHAFLAAQNAFTSFLDIPCSLVTRTGSWIVVYNSGAPSVVETQSARGGRGVRAEYNKVNVEQVLTAKQPLETELHGFCDLWVPVVSGDRCDNLLVSGPLSRRPWSADDIRQSWLELTGEKPRAQSPHFLEYARSVLRTGEHDRSTRSVEAGASPPDRASRGRSSSAEESWGSQGLQPGR